MDEAKKQALEEEAKAKENAKLKEIQTHKAKVMKMQ
jgi:hypothetical protein